MTGVQTCALPISRIRLWGRSEVKGGAFIAAGKKRIDGGFYRGGERANKGGFYRGGERAVEQNFFRDEESGGIIT